MAIAKLVTTPHTEDESELEAGVLWVISNWKSKGIFSCGLGKANTYPPSEVFDTREAAVIGLRRKLDYALLDGHKRVKNASAAIERAKRFGLYAS